jgi:hypothetical protein
MTETLRVRVFLTLLSLGAALRGGDELAVQNWWMGMAERPAAGGPARIAL